MFSRRKRRTGNGTARAQWLYILWNIPFIWTVKIGITGNVARRRKEIDDSAPGWDIPIWYIKIPFAYQVEQLTHRLCAPLQVRFWGSGKTERFFFPALIPAVVFSLAVFVVRWAAILIATFVVFRFLLSI